MSNPKVFPSSRKARIIGLLRPLKDVTVTAGETATFDCELSYEDIPVEWYLKGKKLEPSDKVKSWHVVALSSSSFFSQVLQSSLLPAPCSLLFLCPFLSFSPSRPHSSLISAEIVKQVLLIFVGFNLMIFFIEM